MLFNLFQHTISTSSGDIKLVAATLLTVTELRYLRGKGAAGRDELAALLRQAGVGHTSLLARPSVI